MITQSDILDLFLLITADHPEDKRFQRNQNEVDITVNFWYLSLKDYLYEDVQDALIWCLHHSRFSPTVADVLDRLKSSVANADGSGTILFTILLNAIAEYLDLEQDFGYTALEKNGKTQGQIAREKALDVYNKLPDVLKKYLWSYAGFVTKCHEYDCSKYGNIIFLKKDFMDFYSDYFQSASPTDIIQLMEHPIYKLTASTNSPDMITD